MESEVEIGKSSMQHKIYGGLNPPRCHSMEGLVPFGSDGKKMALKTEGLVQSLFTKQILHALLSSPLLGHSLPVTNSLGNK